MELYNECNYCTRPFNIKSIECRKCQSYIDFDMIDDDSMNYNDYEDYKDLKNIYKLANSISKSDMYD